MDALTQLVPLVLIVLVFYLLIIRPQQKRARRHRELVAAVDEGDRIVTIGGLHGVVTGVDEDTLRLEIASGTTITLAKQSVQRRTLDADSGAEDESDATG
jgi:preprotein translocase subunit YajC